MRVLMTTVPVPAHLAAMVPLARALRAAGHEVLVAGQPDVQPTARAARLAAVCVGGWYHADDDLFTGLPPGSRPLQISGRPSSAQLAAGVKGFAGHARYMVPRYLELAREWRPDVVVGSQYEFASPVVAAVLGVPAVSHRSGVDALSAGLRGMAAFFLTGLCRRLGVDGLPAPDLVLDPCPAALQHAGAAPGLPIGPEPLETGGEHAGRRGVYVDLSDRTRALYGRALPPAVEAAVGGPDGVGFAPSMAGCAAVVHDGSAQAALAAASRGLPQLVLPQVMEEFATGDAVAAAGAGIILDSAAAQDDPARIGSGLRRLLGEPGFGAAAGRLARQAAAMPAPDRLVAEVHQLATTHRTRRRNAA
ncbi:nucleotide disphospho-sugar-binding domain-containing protein [Streptomyces rimosus]|uniref:nucleotide disphospho-sugar-binding domain-containing protein n=1 Tax=Streptomyces rimosus TaxID=1927 RepID=UPI0004CC7770|nr:nucleotide disphospho-sugar-binding domain-containing protein [Streptomyces rimosus]